MTHGQTSCSKILVKKRRWYRGTSCCCCCGLVVLILADTLTWKQPGVDDDTTPADWNALSRRHRNRISSTQSHQLDGSSWFDQTFLEQPHRDWVGIAVFVHIPRRHHLVWRAESRRTRYQWTWSMALWCRRPKRGSQILSCRRNCGNPRLWYRHFLVVVVESL